MQLSFYVLETGKLPEGIKATLARVIPTFAGKKVRLVIEEAKEKRSTDANRYYWGVLVEEVRKFHLEQGHAISPDDCHEELLAVYAPMVERKALDGSIKLTPLRSSAMNKEQFYKYCLTIEVALADFGIILPAHETWQ